MDKDYLVKITNELYKITLFFPKKEPLRYKMRELADEILAKLVSFEKNPDNLPSGNYRGQTPAIFADLGVLDCFFEIAREQNWVLPVKLLGIQREYAKIREGLEKIKMAFPPVSPPQGASEIDAIDSKDLISFSAMKEEILSQPQRNLNYNPAIPQEPSVYRPAASPQEKILDSNPATVRRGKILDFLREKGKAQVWELKKIFLEVTKRTLRRDVEHLLKQGLIERIGERNETFYKIKEISIS